MSGWSPLHLAAQNGNLIWGSKNSQIRLKREKFAGLLCKIMRIVQFSIACCNSPGPYMPNACTCFTSDGKISENDGPPEVWHGLGTPQPNYNLIKEIFQVSNFQVTQIR